MNEGHDTTHAQLLHSLHETSRRFQRPLAGAEVYAIQTKLFLLRARREAGSHQKRQCLDRLVGGTELIAMALESLRRADAEWPEMPPAESIGIVVDPAPAGALQ